jgi:hypothetical protein
MNENGVLLPNDIIFPETDNTVSTIPVMVNVTTNIQCTMTLTMTVDLHLC